MTLNHLNNALRRPAWVALLLLASMSAWAADEEEEHSAHHPQARAAVSTASDAEDPGTASAVDQQMQAMQAMHDRMRQAKTADERRALMAEHMRTMRDGMGMMQKMRSSRGMGGMSCDMHARQQMLERRMDLMQSMMQMMMDRLPPTPEQ